MPKRLLRSVIDFEDGVISPENLSVNFQRLQASTLEWAQPADEKIFTFVRDYFRNHLDLPTARTINDFFRASNDVEVEERIKDLAATPAYAKTNFAHLLKTKIEDQNRIRMISLLRETGEVVSKGLILQEGREKVRIQGVKDGLLHFNRRVHDLIPPENNVRTRGDLRDDTQAAWDEYQEAKANKDRAYGAFVGINQIDTVCRGLKRGELWIHAAFAGELKTSFALNWAYNAVTRYKKNVFYVSLEMPYEQLRRMIYVLHSSHEKFAEEGYEPLDYRKVRDGELTPEEEAFYLKVLEDFNNNPDYCHFEVWGPDHDVTISDIRLEAELLHKQLEVGLTVIDHGGLVKPMEKDSNYVIRLNSVLRDAKKFALHFNGGEGMPVLLLFQINRDGKDAAEKNEGLYKLRALSYANEAERSADTITTTFLDDKHRANGTTMCCCLKNRENPLFDPFLIKIDFSCRRMYNLDPSSIETDDISVDDHHNMLEELNFV